MPDVKRTIRPFVFAEDPYTVLPHTDYNSYPMLVFATGGAITKVRGAINGYSSHTILRDSVMIMAPLAEHSVEKPAGAARRSMNVRSFAK